MHLRLNCGMFEIRNDNLGQNATGKLTIDFRRVSVKFDIIWKKKRSSSKSSAPYEFILDQSYVDIPADFVDCQITEGNWAAKMIQKAMEVFK